MWPINGYMYGLKTLTKQPQSDSVNMDIKIESMALVTVVNICRVDWCTLGARGFVFVARLLQLRYKKEETLWHPGYN